MLPWMLREAGTQQPDGPYLPASVTHIAANGHSSHDSLPGVPTQCWAHYPDCKHFPDPCAHSHVSCCGILTADPLGLCDKHRAEILP